MPKFETGPSPEQLKQKHEVAAEKDIEQKPEIPEELSPEQESEQRERGISAKETEKSRLEKLVEDTKAKLAGLREKMGPPSSTEEPPSIASEKERIEKLERELEILKADRNLPADSEQAKESAPFRPEPSKTEERERGTEDSKNDINIGDEVYYNGRIFRVHSFQGRKPGMKKETDWEADPSGKTTKEVRDAGGVVTIADTKGGVRDWRGVGWDSIEKVTPENREKIEKMIKENEL